MTVDFEISSSKKVKTIDKKIDDFRKKIKDSDDLKVQDEVFDSATLMALYKLASKGYIDALGGTVSTGKEANVFHAIKEIDQVQQEFAIKIYRITTGNFKAMQEYIIGDERFKNIKHKKKDIILAWTRKEFRNLTRAKEAGLNVPQPLITERNILILEFIGKDNIPFPQLREFNLEYEEAVKLESEIEDFMLRLFRDAELVHGDLSEYNILIDPDDLTPVFIDMGQSVTLEHLNAKDFLTRDINNIARFFKKFGVIVDEEALLSKIIKSRADH